MDVSFQNHAEVCLTDLAIDQSLPGIPCVTLGFLSKPEDTESLTVDAPAEMSETVHVFSKFTVILSS